MVIASLLQSRTLSITLWQKMDELFIEWWSTGRLQKCYKVLHRFIVEVLHRCCRGVAESYSHQTDISTQQLEVQCDKRDSVSALCV